jgi:GTP diphosphokinase / guanosine-3',5'-bis(diphosphate) 3'-diphosphatase
MPAGTAALRTRAHRLVRHVSTAATRPAGGTAAVQPLIAEHRRVFPRADIGPLLRAYEVAERYHRGQVRKSGVPYITHPLAVAELLAVIGMDTTTLVAALLHDAVEDTDLPIGQVKAEFGPEVAILVDGVTKLDGARWGDQAEAETFRKMIMAASIDLRVLVIKLADRVHNMRTLGFHAKREKRERIARATLQLLIPFAGRLGLYAYQRELEDLVFAVLEPEEHGKLRDLVRSTAPGRNAYLTPLMAQMRMVLTAGDIQARVEARDRHLYSVYRDLPCGVDGTLRPRNATRLVAVVDGPDTNCYVALGALHARWRPVESRFKDYVAIPKHNMYRSLHTSLLADDGEAVDVIIRSAAMDAVATYGVAAHIRAAGGRTGRVSVESARRADLKWLDRLLAWQPLSTSQDFLESLRGDLDGAGFLVFAANGSTVALPSGSTGVDFAYMTSPDIANEVTGVLVDGVRVPIERPLAHGQVVELIFGPPADPPQEWLEAARSGQARAYLQQWFASRDNAAARAEAEREAEQAALAGRRNLAETLLAHGLALLDLESDGTAHSQCRRLGYADLDALYVAVGQGSVPIDDLVALLTMLALDAQALDGANRVSRSTLTGERLTRFIKYVRRCPTLPRGLPRSTIGAERLNFRVRDGTGCFPFAVAAETLWSCTARPYLQNRIVDASIALAKKMLSQVLGLLVLVSCTPRGASTSSLSTQSSTGGLTRLTLREPSS